MPFYEILHTVPLLPSQQDELATAITHLHAHKFTTPAMFVHVKFTDITASPVYIGGKQRHQKSHIMAHIRTGPSRSLSDYDDLTAELQKAWDSIVKPIPKVRRSDGDGEGDRELWSIFVLGGLEAGREAGFAIPQAGKDVAWLAENMAAFKAQAAEGGSKGEILGELVKEVEERGLLGGYKSKMQLLEEELGWGDSA